jgi:hypothetical protein
MVWEQMTKSFGLPCHNFKRVWDVSAEKTSEGMGQRRKGDSQSPGGTIAYWFP